MYEDQKFLREGWAIKVPLGNDELYVTHADRVVLYNTEQEAIEAGKMWKRYRVVYFSNYA